VDRAHAWVPERAARVVQTHLDDSARERAGSGRHGFVRVAPIAVRVTRGLFDDLFPRTSDLTRAAVSDATVPSAGGSRNGANAEVCEANGATRERQEHALRGVRAKFERGPTSFEASHQPKLSSSAQPEWRQILLCPGAFLRIHQ